MNKYISISLSAIIGVAIIVSIIFYSIILYENSGFVYSEFSTNPPIIDGNVSEGEWDDWHELNLMNSTCTKKVHLSVQNDENHMYICVKFNATSDDFVIYLLLGNVNGGEISGVTRELDTGSRIVWFGTHFLTPSYIPNCEWSTETKYANEQVICESSIEFGSDGCPVNDDNRVDFNIWVNENNISYKYFDLEGHDLTGFIHFKLSKGAFYDYLLWKKDLFMASSLYIGSWESLYSTETLKG